MNGRLFLGTALLLALAVPSRAQKDPLPDTEAGRMVLELEPGVDVSIIAAAFGLEVLHSIEDASLYLTCPTDALPVGGAEMLCDLMNRTAGIVNAELDTYSVLSDVLGCAPLAPVEVQQCTAGFVNGAAGQPCDPSAWVDSLFLPPIASLRPVRVAVLDTGVAIQHPLIAASIGGPGYDVLLQRPWGIEFPDSTDDDNDGLIDEAYGHGTHVAGTIAQINPMAELLPYRVVDSDGNGWAYDVAAGIYRALADGAEVINLSLSLVRRSWAVERAIQTALAADVDVVCAAGNTARNQVLFPASMASPPGSQFGVIAVASVDEDFLRAPFSAYGTVDVAALGVDTCSSLPDASYGMASGTSMSTAVVTGVSSRLRGRSSNPNVTDVMIIFAAIVAPHTDPVYGPQMGAGVIDGRLLHVLY